MEEKEPRTGYFHFYFSYYRSLLKMSDEQQLAFFHAMCDYAFFQNNPNFDEPLMDALWEQTSATIESGVQSITNGKKGGRPKKDAVEESQKGGLKGGLKPPLKPGLKQRERERERKREIKKQPEHLMAVCTECGGPVERNRNSGSPNWVCKQCKQPFTPAQIAEMEVYNNG